jgi:predicted MFS family arabinose efflux permease
MGLIGAGFGLGFVLGPAIGGVLSKFGYNVPFLFAAGLALCNATALYFFLPESLKKTGPVRVRQNRFAELFNSLGQRRFRMITIVYFLIVTAFSIMTTSFALYTMFRFDYDAEHNGYIFAYIGILAIVMQGGIFGRLAERFGESRLVTVGCFLLAASLFAVPFVGPASGGLTALLIGTAFFSVGNSLASPGLSSLASKNASAHEQGKAMGVIQSGASLARAVGLLLAGVLLNNAFGKVDDHTLLVTFWTASAIMLLAFVAAAFSLRDLPQRAEAS